MNVVSSGDLSNMSSSDGFLKRQYNINYPQALYQEEFNRMRERLFRILSKVPIQVETNESRKQNEEETKGSYQRNKLSDKEPVTIKYYNQKSLAEILELHFSCSLIKHNFKHGITPEEPLNSYVGTIPEPSAPVGSSGWQVEETPLGYTTSLPGIQIQSAGSQQPVAANQYLPQTKLYHQNPEVSRKQVWNSTVKSTARTGSYEASNDDCSLELVDGQRHSTPGLRQVGSTSSLAQVRPIVSDGYYVAQPQQHQQQLNNCARLAPEVTCQPNVEQHGHNQINPFSPQTDHCNFLQVPTCRSTEESIQVLDQHTPIVGHQEPSIYYQSNYRASSLMQQQHHLHQNIHQHQQQLPDHWIHPQTPTIDYQQHLNHLQMNIEPTKIIMIESSPALKQIGPLDQELHYQHPTAYTATTSACCTFVYGDSDQSLSNSVQPSANHHHHHQQPAQVMAGWTLQN